MIDHHRKQGVFHRHLRLWLRTAQPQYKESTLKGQRSGWKSEEKKSFMSEKENKDLGRKLGLGAVLALGVGTTVGSGIFSSLSEVAGAAGSALFLVLSL